MSDHANLDDADWFAADREHEIKLAAMKADEDERQREHRQFVMAQRTKRVGYAVTGLTVVAIILGIVYAILSGAQSGSDAYERRELACTEAGGTFTYLGGTGDGKVCVKFEQLNPEGDRQ